MRLIVVSLISVLAFAGLIVGAKALGSRQPPPKALAQLHLTTCALPCWLGIRPGETGFDEAVQHVNAVYAPLDVTVQKTQIFVGYLLGQSSGAASIQVAGGIVNTIYLLAFDIDGLTVGDVAIYFGLPACVLNPSPLVLMYRSPHAYALVVADGGSEDRWRQPLNSIEIHSLSDSNQALLCWIAQQ